MSNIIHAQFTDDFERFNYSERISPQSLNWITWSEDPTANTGYIADEDGIISNVNYPNYGQTTHFAFSGNQALFIGKNNLGSQPQDVVLDLKNKSKGIWNLSWQMYIPNKKNKAYYNFQENTPINGIGKWAIQVYFNGRGKGQIVDDKGNKTVNFSYPWREWFELKHSIDLDGDFIKIELITNSGTTVIYNAAFLSNSQHLGGVDFYSNSNKSKFYIDNIVFNKTLPIQDFYIWQNSRWEDASGNPISGEPDNSYAVIIKEPFIVGTSNSSNTLNCLNLSFEAAGSLTIPSQNNVVVAGNLTVPASNTIRVEDKGSFVMINNNATIDITNSNSFKYIRKSAMMQNNSDYTYWSSPLKGQNISVFESAAVYTYNTANFIDLYSGRGYPQIAGTPDNYDDNGDDWTSVNSTDNIIAGKGYAVLTNATNAAQTVIFTGVPQNGFVSIPVSLSGDSTDNNDDWNLIGNPYPSAIDAKLLINSNINISGTLYFWTHNTLIGGGSNAGPADSNYNENDYATFNLSGGIAAGTGGAIPNGYISAGQGFFMDVNNNGTVTFNNDMRVVNTLDENSQFFKTSKDKVKIKEEDFAVNKSKIWLNFTNDKGVFSQALIAFLPNATNGYESNYDGVRGGVDLNSTFYSVLEDKELAIQGRSVLTDETEIPLGYSITKPDSFTIAIANLEGLLKNSISVFLVDKKLHKIHDLKESDYHFSVLEAGKNNTRFVLKFMSTTLDIPVFKPLDINFMVKRKDGFIEISSDQEINKIELYDLLGRLILRRNPHRKNFDLQNLKAKKESILVLKGFLANGNVISKKIIY